MKTFFKRLLLLTGLLLFLFIGTVLVLLNFFEERIGQQVVTELNTQLKTEIRIKGFELSFLRSFPNVGANLKGVELDGTDGELLLAANELSFRAGLFSLFGSQMKLKSVVISDGGLYLATDRRGRVNYEIFRTEDTPTEDSGGAIDLQNALVSNMQLRRPIWERPLPTHQHRRPPTSTAGNGRQTAACRTGDPLRRQLPGGFGPRIVPDRPVCPPGRGPAPDYQWHVSAAAQ
jgi:hypothetical protein